MITQSEFLRDLAEYTHFTAGDLMNRANILRENDMLARGGRGLSARSIEPAEAASIILAAMSGASANTCPDAVKRLSMLKNTRGIDLGVTLAEILSDPLKADQIKSFTIDYVNGYAVVTWNDREEEIFGNKNDEANSGVRVVFHGRVFRLLACALLGDDPKFKDKAYFKWVKQVIKLGDEQGDAAAQIWMQENPFKPEKG